MVYNSFSFIKTVQRFLYCWIFLTKLPCVPLPKASKEDWGRIAPYFVVVGYILGLMLFFSSKILVSFKLPVMFSALLIVFLWEFFTGGLHLDGLMDTFDGINCTNPERKFEAMKDSRVGAFGAIAGIFIILFKVVCLCTVFVNKTFWIIILSLILSRLMVVYSFSFFKSSLTPGASSSLLLNGVKRPKDFLINLAMFILLVSFCSFAPIKAWLCIMWSLPLSLITALYFHRYFDGHTGDTFGALIEISEVIVLAVYIFLR